MRPALTSLAITAALFIGSVGHAVKFISTTTCTTPPPTTTTTVQPMEDCPRCY